MQVRSNARWTCAHVLEAFEANHRSSLSPPTSDKKYEDAVEKYTEAIDLNPNVAAYYANRAFAHTKLEAYGAAILYVSHLSES